MAIKTYPTKTQATKAKKYGQTVRRRRDGRWICENPKPKYRKTDIDSTGIEVLT